MSGMNGWSIIHVTGSLLLEYLTTLRKQNIAGGPWGVSLHRLVISDVVRYLNARLHKNLIAFNAKIQCKEHN